jgi:hypothetical protein
MVIKENFSRDLTDKLLNGIMFVISHLQKTHLAPNLSIHSVRQFVAQRHMALVDDRTSTATRKFVQN